VNHSDRLRELERQMATLDERVKNLRSGVELMASDFSAATKQFQKVDKRILLVTRDVERHEKRFDDTRDRWWRYSELFFAAVLGGLVTVGAQLVIKAIEQRTTDRMPGRRVNHSPVKEGVRMSPSVQNVLEAFQRLTEDEQRELASAILRGVTELDEPPLNDEALTMIAEESFRLSMTSARQPWTMAKPSEGDTKSWRPFRG